MGQQANLRVQVLGVLAVAVDGREVPPQELASRLDRMAARLPPDLRLPFLEQGRLARALGDARR